MKKQILLTFAMVLLYGCYPFPKQSNYTPISEQSQPIIIIKDSIVCDSDLSFHPQQHLNAAPAQTTTTESGKNNYIFYCFAFIICIILGVWGIKKARGNK